MHRFSALCLAAMLLAAPTVSAPAWAQDDWSVTRDPFDRKIIARYKRILERNPSDKSALNKLIRLYRRHRSVAKLVNEYERDLQKSPNDYSAAVVLGHIHLAQGASDQAMGYYEKAAAIRPGGAAVQLALADLYRAAGKNAEASAAYARVLESKLSKSQRQQAVRALADLALASGDIATAKQHYRTLIALDPRNAQLEVELGDALLQYDQHADAIAAFERAAGKLRADPVRQIEVITRIGAAHEAAGHEERAIRAYRRAMGRVSKSYYLRKELIARIIDIYRRRQALPDLIAESEKSWPARRRGHFEWDVLARLYEETGDQEKAITAFREATRKAPYELDTQRRLIALLENSGREDEALEQYEAVIRVAPGEPRFQLELAERYWRRGRDKNALALLAKAERRFPGDAGVHAAIADMYARWGKADLALKTHIRLTRIDPSDITHLVNLGEQYFQRDQKKKAVSVWKKIVARKTPQNYARLGEVYAEHDLLSEALAVYKQAIRLEPKNPEHYKGRAAVYERRKNYKQAIGDWEKVLSLIPDRDADKPARREARRRVVNLLKRTRGIDLHRRANAWRTAFESDPPDTEAGYFLVELYLRDRNNYNRVRAILEKLLTIDAKDVEAIEQLIKLYRRAAKPEYDKAVALLERLAELSPGRKRELYSEIAEIKTAQRRDDEAIEWINKAVESSPKDPIARQRLAERYVEMQQFDKAIAAYEKTIELDKRNFRSHFALARLYIHTRKADRAAALYREVLRNATDDEVLRKAGQEAIALEEMTDSLGGLERVLSPLAFTFGHKPIYRRVLVQLYARYVPRLVRASRKGTDETRKAALDELHRLGTHGLKPLLEALSDESDPAQQRIAVSVLGFLGNKGAAAPLVRLAKLPGLAAAEHRRLGSLRPVLDWDVRVEALVAAGRLGDPRTIDSLVELSKHREKTMREAATFALGRTGHRDAIAPLVAALDDRIESIKALGCVGLAQIPAARSDGKVVAKLTDVLADRQSDDAARAACGFAIGYLGVRSAVPTLVDTLSQGNDQAQRLAAWALGRIGAKQATSALLAAYFSRHEHVRRVVGWALTHTMAGKPAELPAVDFSEYPMKRTKYDVAAAIEGLPGPMDAAWPSPVIVIGHESDLVAGLRSALSRHRDLVVRVLGDLDRADHHISLGPLTSDVAGVPRRRLAAVTLALTGIGRSIAPQLAELTGHRDPKVRSLALAVIAKVDVPDTKDVLLQGMKDRVASVRLRAMLAAANHVRLYDRHGGELAGAVASRLTSKSWKARKEAAEALGEFGKYASHAALAAAAAEPNAYVREQAVLSLGKLGHKDSLEALIRASEDELPVVRLAAVNALAAIGGPRATARLREIARGDAAPSVAGAARSVLLRTKN